MRLAMSSQARSWWELTLTWDMGPSHGSMFAASRNFLRFNQNLDTSLRLGAGNHLADEPHYHIPSLWPFSSSITTLRAGPIWLLMSWSGGKTCNKPCYVIIESHRINPCQTVLQREDINSRALQAAGRELQVSPGSLTVLWADPGSGAGIVFSSHLILQPTTVITWRHIRRFIKLNLSVLLINSQYNLRSFYISHNFT